MNGNSSNYKRTPIEHLIDLDAPDHPEPSEPKYDPKFQKYLRGDVKSQFMNGANGGVEHFMPPAPPAPDMQRGRGGPPMVSYLDDNFGGGMTEHFTPPQAAGQAPPALMRADAPAAPSINCQDFYNHVRACPICSKFYNTDRTIYVIIIVLLSLVSLILLKRVLEK